MYRINLSSQIIIEREGRKKQAPLPYHLFSILSILSAYIKISTISLHTHNLNALFDKSVATAVLSSKLFTFAGRP